MVKTFGGTASFALLPLSAASPVSPTALAGLLDRIEDRTISGKIAKEVFDAMWAFHDGAAGGLAPPVAQRQPLARVQRYYNGAGGGLAGPMRAGCWP